MFAKLSALALVASPLAFALSLYPLTDATAGGTVTITWTASSTDPPFSLELDNPNNFHNTFAIANTVYPALGELTITLPQMPAGAGYRLKAFAVNDVNTVYSETTEFSVGVGNSTSSTETSTDSVTSTAGSTSSDSVTSTSALSASTTTHTSSASTSAAKTSASSSSSISPSSLGGGAAPLRLGGVAPAAALLLSAVAGAALVF